MFRSLQTKQYSKLSILLETKDSKKFLNNFNNNTFDYDTFIAIVIWKN